MLLAHCNRHGLLANISIRNRRTVGNLQDLLLGMINADTAIGALGSGFLIREWVISPLQGRARVGVEIETVRSQLFVPPSVRVLLRRMPRTTTAYPLRVQPSP
jgi:hypothetical protein